MKSSEKQPIHVRYIRSEATLPQVRESLTTYSQPLQAVTVVIRFSKVGRVVHGQNVYIY